MSGARKPTTIGKFNQVIDQLFEVCRQHYENPETIQFYQYQLDLGRRSNPRMVINQAMKMLEPFIDQIMTRDESFFLNLNLNQVTHQAGVKELGILESLRKIWQVVDERVKDKVWKLIQLTLMYGVMVTKDPGQLTLINRHRSTPLTV
jgi:hypothetical protein